MYFKEKQRGVGGKDRARRCATPMNTGSFVGMSPSGKAPDFDSGIRRFESCHPSHDPLAQLAEQLPFKQWVWSSNLQRVTSSEIPLTAPFPAPSGRKTAPDGEFLRFRARTASLGSRPGLDASLRSRLGRGLRIPLVSACGGNFAGRGFTVLSFRPDITGGQASPATRRLVKAVVGLALFLSAMNK